MKIKTTNGHEVELHDQITRRIRRQANEPMNIMKMKVRQENGESVTEMEPLEVNTTELEDAKVKALVIKIDGKEDVLEEFLNLPDEDCDEVMKKIAELLGETKEEQDKLKKK